MNPQKILQEKWCKLVQSLYLQPKVHTLLLFFLHISSLIHSIVLLFMLTG
jgi:hypothetical protein